MSGVYNQQAPKIAGYADTLGKFGEATLDPSALQAAQGYITDTLSGDPASNPQLDSIIAARNNDLRNQMQAAMGTRGQTGGSQYADVISTNLARQDDELRYTDWANEMARRAQAAGMASGTYAPGMSALGGAAGLPMGAAAQYAAGTGGLLGQYTNTTQKQGFGLGDALGMGLQAASLFSDERLKEDIRRVGETDGGLPLYAFRYKGDDTFHIGPLAQEVEIMQPAAMGPERAGFKTVFYGALR